MLVGYDTAAAVAAGVGRGGGGWSATSLRELTELTHCFHEAARLYPSAPVLTRVATCGGVVCGYEVPAGTEVVCNTYACHRDGRIRRAGGRVAAGRGPRRQPGGAAPRGIDERAAGRLTFWGRQPRVHRPAAVVHREQDGRGGAAAALPDRERAARRGRGRGSPASCARRTL
jgi:hypothetical protein